MKYLSPPASVQVAVIRLILCARKESPLLGCDLQNVLSLICSMSMTGNSKLWRREKTKSQNYLPIKSTAVI